MRKAWLACFLAQTLFFSSCTLHPRYCRPEMAGEDHWRFSPSMPMAANTDYWWKHLQDPVLNDLIDQGLKKNTTLLIAIATVKEYAANLQIASAALFPQVSIDASAEREKISLSEATAIFAPSRISNLISALSNIQYLVDIWGQARSARQAAQAQLQQQESLRKSVVASIVTSIASTYLTLRQFDQELLIANETLASRQQSYRLAQLRFELGLTSLMPVLQSKSELDFTDYRQKTLLLAVAQTEDLLSVLTGKMPGEIPRGLSIMEMAALPVIPAGLPSDILSSRPDVLAAEYQLIGANANIGVAKSAFFPQILLTGSAGQVSEQLSSLLKSSSNAWSYGLNLLQEVFTGGRLSGNVKLSQAQMQAALHQYENAVLNACQQVNDALIGNRIAQENAHVLKDRTDSLYGYYKMAQLQYEEGEVDYLNVLDAERQLFLTQLDYIEAYAQTYLTVFELYNAIGGSWIEQADAQSLQQQLCTP